MTDSSVTHTTVVIPVFNGLPQLADCLTSLAWSPELGVSVVVVDAGSTDGSLAAVADLAPSAQVVHADSSMWWAASVDIGCRAAIERGAQLLCLLNHDCTLSRASLLELVSCHEEHDDMIVCSHVVDQSDGRTWFAGGLRAPSGLLRIRGWGASPGAVFPPGRVRWCGGMGVMFSRQVLESLGGFDHEALPHYYADADFCLRAARRGIATWFCPSALVRVDMTSSGSNVPRDDARVADVVSALLSRRSTVNLRDSVVFYGRHSGWRAPLALAHLYAVWSGMAVVRLFRRWRGRCRPSR